MNLTRKSMKKNFLKVGALCGLLLLGCINQAEANLSQVKDGIEMYGGYTVLGSLGTVTVDTKSSPYVITVPAPKEDIHGTSPNSEWYINANGQLVITLRRYVLELSPKEQVIISVGVEMSNGEIGIYEITLIGAA